MTRGTGEFSAAVAALVATSTSPTSTATTETLTKTTTRASTSTPTSTATATSRTSGEPMDPAAVLLERPRRAGDASALLQFVEKPGCVRLWHGKQCRDERSICHRLHRQPVEDGQNSIVGGGEGRHDEWPTASGWSAPAAACCASAEGRSRPGVLLVTHLIVPHGGSGARASAHRNARAHLSLSASSTLASVRASPQSPAPRRHPGDTSA